MAASTVQNPTVAAESKSAKKKKAKAEAAAAAAVSTKPDTPSADSTNGEGSDESPYLKELHK